MKKKLSLLFFILFTSTAFGDDSPLVIERCSSNSQCGSTTQCMSTPTNFLSDEGDLSDPHLNTLLTPSAPGCTTHNECSTKHCVTLNTPSEGGSASLQRQCAPLKICRCVSALESATQASQCCPGLVFSSTTGKCISPSQNLELAVNGIDFDAAQNCSVQIQKEGTVLSGNALQEHHAHYLKLITEDVLNIFQFATEKSNAPCFMLDATLNYSALRRKKVYEIALNNLKVRLQEINTQQNDALDEMKTLDFLIQQHLVAAEFYGKVGAEITSDDLTQKSEIPAKYDTSKRKMAAHFKVIQEAINVYHHANTRDAHFDGLVKKNNACRPLGSLSLKKQPRHMFSGDHGVFYFRKNRKNFYPKSPREMMNEKIREHFPDDTLAQNGSYKKTFLMLPDGIASSFWGRDWGGGNTYARIVDVEHFVGYDGNQLNPLRLKIKEQLKKDHLIKDFLGIDAIPSAPANSSEKPREQIYDELATKVFASILYYGASTESKYAWKNFNPLQSKLNTAAKMAQNLIELGEYYTGYQEAYLSAATCLLNKKQALQDQLYDQSGVRDDTATLTANTDQQGGQTLNHESSAHVVHTTQSAGTITLENGTYAFTPQPLSTLSNTLGSQQKTNNHLSGSRLAGQSGTSSQRQAFSGYPTKTAQKASSESQKKAASAYRETLARSNQALSSGTLNSLRKYGALKGALSKSSAFLRGSSLSQKKLTSKETKEGSKKNLDPQEKNLQKPTSHYGQVSTFTPEGSLHEHTKNSSQVLGKEEAGLMLKDLERGFKINGDTLFHQVSRAYMNSLEVLIGP